MTATHLAKIVAAAYFTAAHIEGRRHEIRVPELHLAFSGLHHVRVLITGEADQGVFAGACVVRCGQTLIKISDSER